MKNVILYVRESTRDARTVLDSVSEPFKQSDIYTRLLRELMPRTIYEMRLTVRESIR